MPEILLPDHASISASTEQVSCDLEGEIICLHHGKGEYFGTREVGASVWKMIQSPIKFQDIRLAILEAYQVSPEQCQKDLQHFISQLIAKGLAVADY